MEKSGKRKPLQFFVSEDLAKEISSFAERRGTSTAEVLRASVRLYILMSEQIDEGYSLVFKRDGHEKEVLVV